MHVTPASPGTHLPVCHVHGVDLVADPGLLSPPFRLQARCVFNGSDFLPLQAAVFPLAAPASVAQPGPLRLQLRIAKGTASPRGPPFSSTPSSPPRLAARGSRALCPQTRLSAPTTRQGTTRWCGCSWSPCPWRSGCCRGRTPAWRWCCTAAGPPPAPAPSSSRSGPSCPTGERRRRPAPQAPRLPHSLPRSAEPPASPPRCPFEGDSYRTRLVALDGAALPFRAHYQRFTVATFAFLNASSGSALRGPVSSLSPRSEHPMPHACHHLPQCPALRCRHRPPDGSPHLVSWRPGLRAPR